MATLNTRRTSGFIPLLPQDDTEWVILLDWLEFAMSKEQMGRIIQIWNNGADVEERNPIEVLMALIHQAEKGAKVRPWRD